MRVNISLDRILQQTRDPSVFFTASNWIPLYKQYYILMYLTKWILYFPDCKDLFELSAIVPRYAKLGETVVLRCNHTVLENQLYKVQWTKSGNKLFQYIRGRVPPYINHTIPGAKIDVSDTSFFFFLFNYSLSLSLKMKKK